MKGNALESSDVLPEEQDSFAFFSRSANFTVGRLIHKKLQLAIQCFLYGHTEYSGITGDEGRGTVPITLQVQKDRAHETQLCGENGGGGQQVSITRCDTLWSREAVTCWSI